MRGAGDECQRWGDLAHGDRSDALKADLLAAIADCQAELLGDGWFSLTDHGGWGCWWVVVVSDDRVEF